MFEKRHMLVDLRSGQSRPAMPREPVLSSASTPWQGVLLEQHSAGPVEAIEVAPLHHVVGVQLKGTAEIELKNGTRGFRTVRVRPGQAAIFPAMAPISTRTADTGLFVAVTLDPKFVLLAAHELIDPDRFELVSRCPIDDPVLSALGLALKAEAEAGSPGGRVYAESIATTLAMHLVRHHSTRQPVLRQPRGGLARSRLRRAVEFIHDHLADDVPLHALADAAGLSPYHFARLFKRSTGLAPRQYLIRCRLERAKDLLLNANASVADVALRVGFCDQSHFAAHFRRRYGISPKAFFQQAVTSRWRR